MTSENAKIASDVMKSKGKRLLGGRIMDALDAKDRAHEEEMKKLGAELAEQKKFTEMLVNKDFYDRQKAEISSLRAALVEKDKALKPFAEWDYPAGQYSPHEWIALIQQARKALAPAPQKCEHDVKNFWDAGSVGIVQKSKYPECPYCPAPKAQADKCEHVWMLDRYSRKTFCKNCRLIWINDPTQPETKAPVKEIIEAASKIIDESRKGFPFSEFAVYWEIDLKEAVAIFHRLRDALAAHAKATQEREAIEDEIEKLLLKWHHSNEKKTWYQKSVEMRELFERLAARKEREL